MPTELGYISGWHGIRGWVKIFSYCEPRQNIFTYPNWLVNKMPMQVEASKINGKKLIAKLTTIDSIEDAESIIGNKVFVQELPKLAKNEWYWQDLLNLSVINCQQQTLGVITQILATGANDVLVVQNNHSNRILIPYTLGTHVLKIDLASQTVTVDWQADN